MAGVGTAYPADYSATYSGPQYTAQQGRTAMAAAMAGATAARPLGGISGVRPGTPNVASATSTTWTVTPFGGYIDLETSATNGGYYFSFLTNSTGGVTAAAGSARVDLLYVQIADTNTSDSTTVAPRVILDYQVGAAGAGIPTLTAPRAFVIAQINVPASGGGAPTVTWVAPYSVAAGGILPVDTLAHLNAITGAPGQHATVYADGANNGDYLWDGTSWAGVPQRIILQRVATAQSIPNGVTTAVTYDGTDLVNKIGAAFSAINRATGLLTCGVAGTFLVRGDVDYAFNATGIRQIFVDKALAATPTTFVSTAAIQPGTFTTPSFPTSGNIESFVTLAVGDVLRLSTAQSSGGALNATAHLTIDKVA